VSRWYVIAVLFDKQVWWEKKKQTLQNETSANSPTYWDVCRCHHTGNDDDYLMDAVHDTRSDWLELHCCHDSMKEKKSMWVWNATTEQHTFSQLTHPHPPLPPPPRPPRQPLWEERWLETYDPPRQ
jgi:hypothetical protein